MRPGTMLRFNIVKPIFSTVSTGLRSKIIIDIGCFDGVLLNEISQKFGCNASGIDLDKQGLTKAHKRSLEVMLADGKKLPIKSSLVDYALCLDVIEHVQQDEVLLNEIFRVLRMGGKLILTTPQKSVKMMPWGDMSLIHKSWGHVREGYSVREITQKLKKCNFSVLQIMYGFGILAQTFYWLLFVSRFVRLPLISTIRNPLFSFAIRVDKYFTSKSHGLEMVIVAQKEILSV